jgi:hypothetical protein
MGLAMGVNNLVDILMKYITIIGGILEAFYFFDMKVFLYLIGENGEIINSDNLKYILE